LVTAFVKSSWLGKTIQTLMIVNALRWQQPMRRTMIDAPDNHLSQWQEECCVSGTGRVRHLGLQSIRN
jgi:SNF2 family DNA or RNA helicase